MFCGQTADFINVRAGDAWRRHK